MRYESSEAALLTIADLNAAGKFVSARNSGHHPNRVGEWRDSGRLVEGKDCFRMTVAGRGRHDVWFYRPAALLRESKRDAKAKAPHSEKLVANWKRFDRLPSDKDVLLRQAEAVRVLDVAKPTLRRWTDQGCPYLQGGRLSTTTRRRGETDIRYWFQAELEAIRRIREKFPRTAAGDDVYTVEQTIELTGLSRKTLRNVRKRKRLGLAAVQRVSVAGTNQPGSWERTRTRVSFTKRSVDAFVSSHPIPTIPVGMMTAADAQERLGVDRKTVNIYLNGGLLRGRPGQSVPTPTGVKVGWLVDAESVNEAAAIIRKHGVGKLVGILKERGAPNPVVPSSQPMPADVADGPCDPFLFRFDGKEIDLSAAPLRHRLLCLLWNAEAGQPFASRTTETILDDLYPGDDDADGSLKVLQSRTNKRLKENGLQIEIRSSGGKFWMEKTA